MESTVCAMAYYFGVILRILTICRQFLILTHMLFYSTLLQVHSKMSAETSSETYVLHVTQQSANFFMIM